MSRSLVNVEVTIKDNGNPYLECPCDCGTVTGVEVHATTPDWLPEVAYTCDGCQSSHWLTFSKVTEANDG